VCHNKERCAVKFVNTTTHNHSISVTADRAKGLLDMLLQGSVTAAEKQLAAREHFNVQSYAVLKFSPHFIGETAPPSLHISDDNALCITCRSPGEFLGGLAPTQPVSEGGDSLRGVSETRLQSGPPAPEGLAGDTAAHRFLLHAGLVSPLARRLHLLP
jgi:hypothetical protein